MTNCSCIATWFIIDSISRDGPDMPIYAIHNKKLTMSTFKPYTPDFSDLRQISYSTLKIAKVFKDGKKEHKQG